MLIEKWVKTPLFLIEKSFRVQYCTAHDFYMVKKHRDLAHFLQMFRVQFRVQSV